MSKKTRFTSLQVAGQVVHHSEQIVCPNCSSIENAVVDHTEPWHTIIHHCNVCQYTILESEWTTLEEYTKQDHV